MSKQVRSHRSHRQQSTSSQEDYHADPNINYSAGTVNANEPRNGLLLNDFEDIKPFITKKEGTQSFAHVKDNTFADYNEEGKNDVNNSQYRKEMIARSVLETINTVNTMFTTIERQEPQTQQTYTPSHCKHRMSRQRATDIVSKFDQSGD